MKQVLSLDGWRRLRRGGRRESMAADLREDLVLPSLVDTYGRILPIFPGDI
jgi:hypothetical protein